MQSIDFETGVWAVIHSGSKKYIGVLSDWLKGTQELFNELNEGKMQTLTPAFALHTELTTVMTREGPAMSHIVQVLPIDGAQGPSTIHTSVDAIHLFSDMQEGDRARHKKLVEGFMEQVQMNRAKQAGLTLASKLPGGGGGRPPMS